MANTQFLHRDHLDSVRAITDGTGAVVERAVYKPFGEQTEWLTASQSVPESKGWIGERFDADAGLQYLNARYYDPVLGMFIQPDWFDVMKPGVGTNRFSYSFNDPVNLSDQNGNIVPIIALAAVAIFAGTNPANAPRPGDQALPPTGDRAMVETLLPPVGAANAVREGDILGAMMDMMPGGKIARGLKGATAATGPVAKTAPKLTIGDHNAHHGAIVDDLKNQLKAQGYRVSDGEISFGSSCGGGRCKPDIIYEGPDGTLYGIEVKTGNAGLSDRQKTIYPQIKSGDAVPRGRNAKEFGLRPGQSLNAQGRNGITIEVRQFPGAGE